MKIRATVTDITDSRGLGRIRARLAGGAGRSSVTPWCWPCSQLAGPGYGMYCLPQVGDEVWVERAAGGEWVWSGFAWSGRNPVPTSGSATSRVFRTPAGHELRFDDGGSVEISHAGGGRITITADGTIAIIGSTVQLAGELNEPVVLGDQLQNFLSGLVQSFNAHTHAAQGSLPPAPAVLPSGLLSNKVTTG